MQADPNRHRDNRFSTRRRIALATLAATTGLSGMTATMSAVHAQIFAAGEMEGQGGSPFLTLTGNAYMLDEIHLRAAEKAETEVYAAPRSSAYISEEALNRVGRSSAADMLRGQPGVQLGDARNGGGLDVNIRGIQGQGRVAVSVDGAQQAHDVYRGYSGTQMRSYIDPDLISEVVINKGTTQDPATAGAVGGSVNMTTLQAADILKPGRKSGIRVRGELQNNGIAPAYRGAKRIDSDSVLKQDISTDRGNIFNSDSKAGSIAAAFAGDNWDAVAAYARREQGNYIAGTEGREKYRRYKLDWKGDPDELNSVAKFYKDGEEVLNSSSQTESVLLKGSYRLNPDQKIELSYRHFNSEYGDIMPSTIYRYGTGSIMQYPLSTVRMNAATLRHDYNPADTDLIALTTKFWWTDTESNRVTGGLAPISLEYNSSYYWAPYHNTRYGLDVTNRSVFANAAGEFTLDLGFGVQRENMRPQDWVVTTEQDRDDLRVMRDAYRWETNLTSRLEYRPNDRLTLWGGLTYSKGRTQDRNDLAYKLDGEKIRTDEKMSNRSSGWAPSAGITYHFGADSFVYASYKEAIRIPSLFDTTMGTVMNTPVAGLKPERSQAIELGVSTTRHDIFGAGDSGSLKLAYFDTEIEDYITRYYDRRTWGRMMMTNADSFSVRGLELQSKYDNGRFFADMAVTRYLDTETCDGKFAAFLRETATSWQKTEDTPDCTPGSFMGSYANTQNPPKTAVSVTAGTRLHDQKLTLGGRLSYTSGPTEVLDKPWNANVTTIQKDYKPVAVIDAFMHYDLSENARFNASVSNLTDRYYLDPLAQSDMPAPGRTFRAALTLKF